MTDQEQQPQPQPRKQLRVVLWCMPRSLSTTVLRAMFNKTNSVPMLEPYTRSYYIGEERISPRFKELFPPLPDFKYSQVKSNMYDAEHEGKDLVFAKDMALFPMQAVERGLYTVEDLLPKDYVHTFLIRKPEKAIKSMYFMYANRKVAGWDYWSPTEAGFKEVYDLYNIIKAKVDYAPLVIDADDLQAKPEAVMRHYCERTGIEYEDSLVNWNPNDGVAERLEGAGPWMPFWESVTDANTFVQNTPAASKSVQAELPAEVQQCIEENKVWYEKMLAVATRF